MKSKTMILMAVAIVCGLAASYMTSRVIAERGEQKSEEEKVTVLVARQNVAMGTLLKEPEKLFEEKPYTKGEEPKKACRTYDQLKDRRLNKPLSAEQFVTPEDLNDKSQDGLPGVMTKGMRAVGLKVNMDAVAGGFVLPHSRVDIVSVIRRSDVETYSKIILQNVLVLAVDTNSNRPDDKQSMVATTVTVQVSPEQAEKLSLATELGTLRLILRAYGDEETVSTAGATPKNVTQASTQKIDEAVIAQDGDSSRPRTPVWGPRVPEVTGGAQQQTVPQKAPETPPPPKTHTLTIFNGESVTKAVFTISDKEIEANATIEKSRPETEPGKKTVPLPATPKVKEIGQN